MKEIRHKKNRVLVFNPSKKLVAMFVSQLEAAKSLETTPQVIHAAITGKSIACKKLYLRTWPDDIEVLPEDWGNLRLEAFDDLCGVERKVFANRKMSRVGMKYETEFKQKRRKTNDSQDSK
jgi:hypothetical protein